VRAIAGFNAARAALLLDIDGTLLDIAPTPEGVSVPTELRETLATLLRGMSGALALVSGRPVADIDRIFAPLALPAIGGHGAEIRANLSGGVTQRAAALDGSLRRALGALASPGVILEDKRYSIAVHYRGAPEKEAKLRAAVDAIAAAAPAGSIELLHGKAVIELKPAGFNKGSAVLELMQRSPFAGRTPFFIGDDVTDEAVFAILPQVCGTGFSVGRTIAGAADVFGGPADVRSWLGRIAERVSA
jgi:trehalose 6-phosphate phosphatase